LRLLDWLSMRVTARVPFPRKESFPSRDAYSSVSKMSLAAALMALTPLSGADP
jgi:hypothetical protein